MVKLEIFNILYQEGDINLVVDTNVEGVRVPPYLYGKITNFILGNSPSPHLQADENGITAPLRFGETRFTCYFPWSSVRAMISRLAVVNFPTSGEKEGEEKAKDEPPRLKLVK
jgi:stringent starvation protein B